MWSRSPYSLSAALEAFEQAFPDSTYQPIPALHAPSNDMGSQYHYAIGPYRVSESHLKKPKRFLQKDIKRIFFTEPTFDDIYWETGAPLSLLSTWYPRLPSNDPESFYYFTSEDEVEPYIRGNHQVYI